MTLSDVNKTSSTAKVRILVEKVIRRLKTFRILTAEMPISITVQVDDMVTICGGLCDFEEFIRIETFAVMKSKLQN